MDRKYDPVWLFLGIIGSQLGINIHTKSTKMQLRRINAYLGYLHNQGYTKFESNYQIGLFMKKLFKNDRFDYIAYETSTYWVILFQIHISKNV